jgi:hypothetical protein
VQFQIGVRGEPARLRGAHIADAAQLVADRRAVDAADRVGVIERESADIDQAAHRIGWKARALFVGESHQRQRAAGDDAGIVERLAGFEAREHAIETVIAAAGADRVHVRAEHDGRGVLASATHTDDVADGVDGDGQAELTHPSHEQVAPGAVVVGKREPAIAAAGQSSDPIECVKPAEQAIEIDPRRSRHSAPPSSMRK